MRKLPIPLFTYLYIRLCQQTLAWSEVVECLRLQPVRLLAAEEK
jgi:hypothetical protein